MARIRIGVGGWTYAPWRGRFYPAGLKHADELPYASRHLTAIEINGTFYRHQTPASFAAWREATPPDFVFTLKAHRVTTHSKPENAGPAVARFLDSGLVELGPKLGPILWQFPPTRAFVPEALAAFLALLPAAHGGCRLRHAVEARHASFDAAEAVLMLRAAGVARVIVDSDKQALTGDLTAPFVYARLQRNSAAAPEGYEAGALDTWTERFAGWRDGRRVRDLPLAAPPAAAVKRDVFGFFISGEKEMAPAAATAMLRRLDPGGSGGRI